jgi:D-lactate dehydrogenase
MRIAFFSAKPYEREYFGRANEKQGHEITYLESRLSAETALLAKGYEAICAFVNDQVDGEVLETLGSDGLKVVALRSAGYNNVDLEAAKRHNIGVVRVPAYSPHAVAEHTVGLLLALNRGIHRANNRVRESNFSLDGLLGFDLYGKTAGVFGTGKIGAVVVQILRGFGMNVLAYDVQENQECLKAGARYVSQDELFAQSDVITLHTPLLKETYHLINEESLAKMKRGVTIINTSRGGLVDTQAVIEGLKSGQVGYLALDVYEEEGDLFFEDRSNRVLQDDVFARLLTFPNVLITGHQAFFTREALTQIAEVTLGNLTEWEKSGCCGNTVG